jgi:hypothetical protein
MSSIERLNINTSNITPNLTQLQNIHDRLLPLKDSLRDLSLAGIDQWRRSDTTDIVAWFKQSLTTGFAYLNSTILTGYLSLGRDFLRELTLAAEYLWHSSDIVAWLTQPRLLQHPIHLIQYQHLNSLIKSPMHKLITAHKLTLPIGSLPVTWIATFVATMIALSRIGFGRAGISKGELALLTPPRLHSHPIHQTQAHPHRPSSPTSMALLLLGVGASPN